MMNEQELADLFATQVDRLLQGEATTLPPDADELSELLDISERLASQAKFQASAPAQAAFHSQVTGWFGLSNGGSPMTILGLSKVWFLSILVTVIIGLGLVAVISSSLSIFTPVQSAPTSSPATAVAAATRTPRTTPQPSATAPVSASATATVRAVAPSTPARPANQTAPSLIFRSNIYLPSLCQGAYTVQRRLANYGNRPVDDAALVWEVIEGVDLVEQVSLDSDGTTALLIDDTSSRAGSDLGSERDTTLATSSVITSEQVNYVFFSPIAVKQEVDVRVKVKVKDDWWDQPDGSSIKVKLHLKNKGKIKEFRGRDDDDDDHGHYQVITVVKRSGQWVTLTGFPQNYGDGKMLLGGYVVTTNDCTGLPVHWPRGSKIKVTGFLQPDGTFIAINIIVVNVNVNLSFDSGVPQPRDDGSRGGGSRGGGGGGRGGGGGGRGGGSGSGSGS